MARSEGVDSRAGAIRSAEHDGMKPLSRWNMSLSYRITVLFGGAVLLTIVVTLAFPSILMSVLTDNALRIRAAQIATVGFDELLEVGGQDWGEAQTRLNERWPVYERQIEATAPPPKLVSVQAAEAHGRTPGTGFLGDAIEYLTRHPGESSYWRFQDDGRRLRLAMAVRAMPTDPRPTALRGVIDVDLPVPTRERAWNWVVTILGGAAGAALAVLVFYVVTQRLVLRPVHALRRVARRVTQGDLTVRAELSTGDEFQQLAEAFNDMLSHLVHINRSLDVRLVELGEKNVALYEANRVKSEFLANVSHELRTPLASIIGFAELSRDLWDSPAPDATRGLRYARNILVSGRALLDIINDLLDLAKIEAGRMELHRSTFAPARICEDSVDFIRPQADKKQIALELAVAPDLPNMVSDSGKIKQILYNLLSNAVKFTPARGTVRLEARRDGEDELMLRVSDSGPGIARDQIPNIFEKFRQLDASKTREHEGTGLGLAITRDLARILGGRIDLVSAPGRGATFTVSLPLNAPEHGSPRDAP